MLTLTSFSIRSPSMPRRSFYTTAAAHASQRAHSE